MAMTRVRVHRNYEFAEKKLVVETFFSDAYEGVSLKGFSEVCGINYFTMRDWMRSIDWDVSRVDELKRRSGGRRKGVDDLLSLAEPVEQLILEVKGCHPDWGPLKIKQYLFRHEQILVPTTRIYKFLKSKGLVNERVKAVQAAHDRSFEYPYPLAAVQMDLMHVTLSSGTTIYLVSLLDDFSRFVLGQRFIAVKTMEEVRSAFLESVRVYGVMERLLTDHGSEFVSWQSFTRFEEMLASLDVEHIQSGPDRKENQGKVERWHETVRSQLRLRGPLDYSSEAQLWIRSVVDEYNYERPHEALGGLVPADRFFGLKEDLEAELDHYRARERQGQKIYFACRVGDQKLVVSGPRSDQLKVLLNGRQVQTTSSAKQQLDSLASSAASDILSQEAVAESDADRQLEEKASAPKEVRSEEDVD